MGRNKTPYAAVLGIERILLEYSDAEHPVSVSFIRSKLKDVYDISISDDVIRGTLLPEMMNFHAADSKTACGLQPGWGIEAEQESARKAIHFYADNRLFEPYEVSYLADAVDSMLFLGEGKSHNLIERIGSLQSIHQRSECRMRRTNNEVRTKPGYYTLAYLLNMLSEAIASNKSISFDYVRYGTRRKSGTYDEQEAVYDTQDRHNGSRIQKCSPYRIQFMDGRYYLLASAAGKTVKKDKFKVYRIDLIDDLAFEEENAFIQLANEGAPTDYFRGALYGIGGKRTNIKLRCSSKALHYVIERFVEFENFRIWKHADDPDGWYEVQFMAHPKAVEYYIYRWVSDIELIAPEQSRKSIEAYLLKCPYMQS